MQLVEALDVIPFFPWHSLTIFTDMNAMAVPAELLVSDATDHRFGNNVSCDLDRYAPCICARALRWS